MSRPNQDDLDTLKAVIDSIADGVVVCDADGRFLLWNPAGERLVGLGFTQAPPEEWQERFGLFRPDTGEPFPTAELPMVRAIAGEEVDEVEVMIKNSAIPDGRWLSANGRPLRDGAGAVTGGVVVFRDISERKLAEMQIHRLNQDLEHRVDDLARANSELSEMTAELSETRDQALESSKLKSEFVANISHELRTPLTAVIGMTEILLQGRLESSDREIAGKAHDSALSLLSIVNDILDFSKIEAGKLHLEAVDFDLIQLIDETVGLLTAQASQKGLALLTQIDPLVPRMVQGDPVRLRQILFNLAGNGIKFTKEGRVTIVVDAVDGADGAVAIKCTVSDTGVGLSAEAMKRLFQPFVQADGATTRKFGGTGLGLSISKRLVDMMGGQIGVASVEGKGAEFWFQVPLNEAADPGEREPDAAADETRLSPYARALDPGLDAADTSTTEPGSREPVLIAEDNQVLQSLAGHQLRRLGYSFKIADNGKEAVAMLREENFSLVLMDVQMPEMDGYEATREIRRHEELSGRRTPIVAMTASVMAGDRQKCLEAGMDDYLAKPVGVDQLRQLMERWVINPSPSPSAGTDR